MFIKLMSDPGFVLVASYILAFLIVINVAGFLALKRMSVALNAKAKSRLESYKSGFEDAQAESDIDSTYFVHGPDAQCYVNSAYNVEEVIDLITSMTGGDEEDYTSTRVELKDAIVLSDAFKRRVASKSEELDTTLPK